ANTHDKMIIYNSACRCGTPAIEFIMENEKCADSTLDHLGIKSLCDIGEPAFPNLLRALETEDYRNIGFSSRVLASMPRKSISIVANAAINGLSFDTRMNAIKVLGYVTDSTDEALMHLNHLLEGFLSGTNLKDAFSSKSENDDSLLEQTITALYNLAIFPVAAHCVRYLGSDEGLSSNPVDVLVDKVLPQLLKIVEAETGELTETETDSSFFTLISATASQIFFLDGSARTSEKLKSAIQSDSVWLRYFALDVI